MLQQAACRKGYWVKMKFEKSWSAERAYDINSWQARLIMFSIIVAVIVIATTALFIINKG